MELEPSQRCELLGPLLVEQALADVPLFGPEKTKLNSVIEKAVTSSAVSGQMVATQTDATSDSDLLAPFSQVSSVADKLTALRIASREAAPRDTTPTVKNLVSVPPGNEPPSQLQRHEQILAEIKGISLLSNQGQALLDHTMLFRAKEGYLFDYAKNSRIVSDDPWLRDVWAWVAGEYFNHYIPTLHNMFLMSF